MLIFLSVCLLQTDDPRCNGHTKRVSVILRKQEVQEEPGRFRQDTELLQKLQRAVRNASDRAQVSSVL